MRLADDEKPDKAVYLWFVQRIRPISGTILCEKFMPRYKKVILMILFRQVGAGFGIFVNTME